MRTLPALYGRTETITAVPQEADDITVFVQYLQVIWKHKWMVLLAGMLGLMTGIGASLMMTPMYMASTSLEIQDVQEPFGAGALMSADAALGTQVQLLSSATMYKRVVDKLAQDPQDFPEVHDPLQPLRDLFGLSDPADTVDWNTAISKAGGNRRIVTTRDSRILVIETRAPNPVAAAAFATTLAEEYIAHNQEQRWASYQSTGEWMTRAQQELKEKLEESEKRLSDFSRQHGLIITGTQNAAEEKLRQLQGELARATADRISKEAFYQSSLSSPTEALPEVLDSGPMAQYQVKIADLRRELAELTTTLTPEHPRTQRVQAQIRELEATRDNELKNIISRIRIDYEAAVKREAQLEQDFRSQAALLSADADELIQYNILLREVETNSKLYEQMLAQVKEASLASAMRTSNARVIDRAAVPLVPTSPNLPLNLGLGLIGGFACGAMFVLVRFSVDARIQSPGTLAPQLSLRELGVIPSATLFSELKGRTRLIAGAKASEKSGAPSIVTTSGDGRNRLESLDLVTWTHKTSVMSEAFRSAMTSILFSGDNGSQPQVLVITSAAPQEGKTTVTTNLAIALAEINRRVLLIDADMRRPSLHTIFDLPNTSGLSDILNDRTPLEEYIDQQLFRNTDIPNLSIMLAGPARSTLSRLLYSMRMKELIARFRNSFDTILVDSAPVLSVPDARILAQSADAVVLVVRAHQTHQESALAAIRCFEEDGRRVLGTILNDWNPKRSPLGPYGRYGSYTPNSSYKIYGPLGEVRGRF